MFMPHCHHFGCLDNRVLFTGIVFGSAFAVQAELEASRRRELEKSNDNRNETTQTESGTTAYLKRNR
ncbi:MAG: hypothetical protein ABSH41_23990 [Syntrophobacteraceae bacterium]